MRKVFKLMVGLGIIIAVAVIGVGCAEEAKVFVINDSAIDMEQSSSDLKINEYKTLKEFEDVIAEIDSSNMQFAPEGYSGTTYDKNCVMFEMASSPHADITLDAEHIITIAKYNNVYYIQYDSFDSAMEAIEKLEEKIFKGVIGVCQDKACISPDETC